MPKPSNPQRFLLAVDLQSNLGLAFNFSGPTANGSVGYTGRKAAAPSGTMQPPAIAAAGASGYYRPGNGRNRWGDYCALALDPEDESTFWGIGQFAETQGNADYDNAVPPQAIPAQNGQWGTGLFSFSERSYFTRNDYNADGLPNLVTRIADRPFSYQGNTTLTYPGPVVATGDFDRDGISGRSRPGRRSRIDNLQRERFAAFLSGGRHHGPAAACEYDAAELSLAAAGGDA